MSSNGMGEAENQGGDVSAGKWGPDPVLEAALWNPRKEGGRLGQGRNTKTWGPKLSHV